MATAVKYLALFFCIGAFSIENFVQSFSVGVLPTRSVCRGMIPGHDTYKPQEKEVPFQITSDVKTVNSGGQVDRIKNLIN